MKKTIIFTLLFICIFILASCSAADERALVGKWVDVESEFIVEYTADGYYKEGLTEDFWQEKTRYEVYDGEITRYIEGDKENTAFTVDYEINDDGHLIINGVIEYKPLDLKTAMGE